MRGRWRRPKTHIRQNGRSVDAAMNITISAIDNGLHGLLNDEAFTLAFRRQWAAQTLAQLVARQQKSEPLAAECLQAELGRLGQPQPLNRTQMRRLMLDLSITLDQLPGQPVKLVHPPRKQSVGPWSIKLTTPITWQLGHAESKAPPRMPATRAQWPSPLLCESANLVHLRALVQALMVADDLYRHGSFAEASNALQQVYTMPITAEARQLVSLRDAYALKQQGDFAGARAACLRILAIASHHHKDPAMPSLAKFMLDRIRYDENPAVAYDALRQTSQPPEHLHVQDRTALAEWHNMQALVSRRHMQAAQHERVQAHELALMHLESALYIRVAAQDAARVPDVLFNLAFHLQKAHTLNLCPLLDICRWYAVAVHYDNRHNLIGGSVWDYLFMGDLWLTHCATLQALMADNSDTRNELQCVLLLDNRHPWQPGFYLEGIRRATQTGEARQQAIAHILAWRFANQCEEGELPAWPHAKALKGLLAQHTTLGDKLAHDGYWDVLHILKAADS
jgi:hypothetical protein